jgi:hypothetical protein
MFRPVLTVNDDEFPNQHLLVDLCNGDEMCFLRGSNWIFICYLEENRPIKC